MPSADASHESRKLTKLIKTEGYELRIVKRSKRAFEVVGLTWSVERTFACIRRYRRMSKDYEHRVQTSETLIELIAIRLIWLSDVRFVGNRFQGRVEAGEDPWLEVGPARFG